MENVNIVTPCNDNEQKIVAFNFKVLNNIFATSYKLRKWKLIDSDICHLCFATGNLEHMMLNCPYFEMYYSTVIHVFEHLGYSNIKTDVYTLICG